MKNTPLLIAAMAEKCKGMLERSQRTDCGLPQVLQPKHLLWMCSRIEEHADDWPEARLHRWIGFVQCGMMANRILDLRGARMMFDEVKNAYGGSGDEEDLIDHLDPDSSFKMDIGGEG